MKLPFQVDGYFPKSFANGKPPVKQMCAAYGVKITGKLPGMMVNGLVAFLKLVQFFNNRYGDNDIVLFKLIDAGAVVKNNIGIENKNLFSFACWLFFFGTTFLRELLFGRDL